MSEHALTPRDVDLPSLRELGPELLQITPFQRIRALILPFMWCGAYFLFAGLGWWPLAAFALVSLSFVSYGSTSHDLVHRNLGLSKRANDILLCLIELLGLRSGHAYQAVHLNHHARYPHTDDIEASAARRSLLGALAEGLVFQFRIWLWAVRHAKGARGWVAVEGSICLAMLAFAAWSYHSTSVFVDYVVLMVMGSWIIPLVTSYLPHDPHANGVLFQTRVFRGVVASVVAVEHLYHLEHHLYPLVPHHNWRRLARLLDPHLERLGVKPIRILF
jgi:beta-carotene hydroxylase